MLKVLIADDEPIVRMGLRSVIDWERHGFTICGDAEDGAEAVQKMEVLQPDIAIVDIHMPEMDGLAVSEYGKKNGLATKIIFLTGFDEFLYARRAIGLGVKAYLLKPVDEESLLETLLSIKEEIRAERRSSTLAEMGAEVTYSRLMESILTGADVWGARDRMLELYDVNLDWRGYQIALVYGSFDRELQKEIKRHAWEFLRERGLGICFELNRQVVILVRERVLTHDHPDALALYSTMNIGRRHAAQLILTDSCASLGDLHSLYRQAVSLTDKGFLLSEHPIVDVAVTMRCCTGNVDNTAAKLVKHIQALDEQAVLEDIEGVKHFLVEFSIGKREVASFYTSLLMAVRNALDAGGVESSLLFEVYSVQREILELDGIEEVEEYAKNKILELMRRRLDRLSMGALQPILEYIQDNLEKDIKLKTLAEQFNYNSAYLGKMFKERTGVAFNEYIDRLKLEKAREYIREGHMVYEAAKLVGYTNINYFHSKFKRYAGISPGAVRKRAKERQQEGKAR